MRVQGWTRWDAGEEDEPNGLEHEVIFTPYSLVGTKFALYFDRMWEWLALHDYQLRHDLSHMEDPTHVSYVEHPFKEDTIRKHWRAQADAAQFWAGAALDIHALEGTIPLKMARLCLDFDKDPTSQELMLEVLRYVKEFGYSRPTPVRIRLCGLLDGMRRLFLHTPTYKKHLGAAIYPAVGEATAHEVHKWVQKHVSENLYSQLLEKTEEW